MFFLSYLLIFILDERRQKYSRSKSLASFSEFLFYCHILSYLFLKNHSEFFYMFGIFYETCWLYLLDKQILQIHHYKDLLFGVNNHPDFFLFHCKLFQTVSNRYCHYQCFCWAAHSLWKKNNMVIDIHSKYQFLTKLRSFKVVPKILLSPNLNIDTYYWGVY